MRLSFYKRIALFSLFLLVSCGSSIAAPVSTVIIPDNAKVYLPSLVQAKNDSWKDNRYPWFLAGQIEQETCVSLRSKRCWNPRTELKTDREYGFGLGQVTVTAKFNNFENLRKMSSKLKSWKWEDRFNPYYQIIGLITLDLDSYSRIKGAETELDRQAFMFSAYNGGLGGVIQDRKLCSTKPGCNPNKWFSNVELYSFKKKTKVAGYGQSFFDINRGYVYNVQLIRSDKYKYAFKL